MCSCIRALWIGAPGQTFFITRGTGFFGMWLLESFAHANDALGLGMRAVVLTRDPANFAQKAPHLTGRTDLEFVQGLLSSFAFPRGRFDHVIHAAADTGVWTERKDADGVIENVVAGTRRLLDFVAGAGVKNFLLVSSGAVYGRQPADLTHISEDYIGAPDPLLTDANYAIGNFIRDAGRGDPIRVLSDGTPRRSYLYAADLAIWLWTLLFRAPAARAYNVGSDLDRMVVEHARSVSEAFGGVSPVHVARPADPAQPLARYVPSIRRARSELGLEVWISEAEAIRRTLRWLGHRR